MVTSSSLENNGVVDEGVVVGCVGGKRCAMAASCCCNVASINSVIISIGLPN